MEPEAVLNLFDSFWFHPKIFEKQPQASTLSTSEPNHIQKDTSKNPNFSRQLMMRTRSESDDLLRINTSFNTNISSPDSVLLKPHLQTILSDREISLEIPKTPQFKKRKDFNKKKKRLSKSLSELEFEEVKGFMDLGFVFSEEDKDSSLVEIIPGLQKLGPNRDDKPGKKDDIRRAEEISGPRVRPYLSEAWEVSDVEESPLLKWRVPVFSNEIDMKDSLKWWAHSVANAVR